VDYLLERIKDNIYVLAIWDHSWNSYNNCYIFLEKEGVVFIDSCKKEHISFLQKALDELGKSPEDVKLVLATHGHKDHVEGASIFTNAKKVIHPKERLDESLGFAPVLSGQGSIEGFDYELVSHHSPGSVIFFHQESKSIFTGDFLCFFGDPLSKEGIVSGGEDLRQAWKDYLKGGGVPAKELPVFLDGLRSIHRLDADVMCTGHGGVLVDEIKGFIKEMLQLGESKSIL
jgi:glyoxylase-like metal-dependent hydrolase (beta-lactamase superfamily II)